MRRVWTAAFDRGLFGTPLDQEYMAGGWTSHLAAFDEPESAERHLDFFGRPPRVGEAWQADADTGIASRDTVAARQGIYERGQARAAALVAATPQDMELVAVPLDTILP